MCTVVSHLAPGGTWLWGACVYPALPHQVPERARRLMARREDVAQIAHNRRGRLPIMERHNELGFRRVEPRLRVGRLHRSCLPRHRIGCRLTYSIDEGSTCTVYS